MKGRILCNQNRLRLGLITPEVLFDILDEKEAEQLVNYLSMLP